MKKDITICFRTSENLREALERVARGERRSLSALIQNVLHDYLNQKRIPPSDKEKRRHPRREVSLPAFTSLGDSEGAHPSIIHDISLGGLRLSLPKEARVSIHEDEEKTYIDILFALPAEKSPVKMRCKPGRIRQTNGEIEVGVAFADCDFPNYQKVQNYLIN